MSAHPYARGMTLIEMLVALALISLLSLGMFSTFRVAQRSYAQSLRIDEAADEMMVAQRFLRRVLESTYPFESPDTSTRHYGLEGAQDAVTVSASGASSATGTGLYRYHISVQPDGKQSDLSVRWTEDRHGANDASLATDVGANHEVLLKDIASVQWSYASSVEENGRQTMRWDSNWAGHVRPPALVRLEVRFPPADRRIWPALVVAPAITDDAHCEFDVVGQVCRGHSG